MTTPLDDITDAELDAMERQHAGQNHRLKVVDDGDDGLRIHCYEDDGADYGDVATMADEDEAYTFLAQSWCDSRGHIMRLIAALREARRRLALASSRGLPACGHCGVAEGQPCNPTCIPAPPPPEAR